MEEKWDRFYDVVIRKLAAPFLIAVVLIVLFNILTAPTYVGTPAKESEALIRANERLLEMVKWTISTILLLGGGLIGLNWYSNDQRYHRDRDALLGENRDLHRKQNERIQAVEGRIADTAVVAETISKSLERVTIGLATLTDQLAVNERNLARGKVYEEIARSADATHISVIDRLMDLSTTSDIQRRAIMDLAFEVIDAAGLTFEAKWRDKVGLQWIPQLADTAERLHYTDDAKRLRLSWDTLQHKNSEV